MPIISNRTDRPVLLAFNSGQTLRLSPRSTSEEIPDVEIVNNAKVAKLAALNIITVGEPQRKRETRRATDEAATASVASAERASSGTRNTPVATKRETTSSKSTKRP